MHLRAKRSAGPFLVVFQDNMIDILSRVVQSEEDAAAEADRRRGTALKRLYDKTAWVWMSVIIYGLVVQALRSAEMSRGRARFIGRDSNVGRHHERLG